MNSTLVRAISGAIYVLLLIACILYSSHSVLLLFGIFLILATIEFSKLVKLNSIVAVCIATGLFLFFGFTNTNKTYDILLLILSLVVSMKALIFLFDNNMKPINDVSKTIYLVGYVAIPFIIITKIPFVNGNSFEPKTLLSLFIFIWVNDTFAFIVGKSLGKNKLFEKISPKKTIEGFIGGMFFSLVASVVLAKYFVTEPVSKWLVIAIISSVFGTLGDLIESKFKRIAGVKDSGSIMPGHGGVLDRLDSIIFVAPIVFLFYQILYYVS